MGAHHTFATFRASDSVTQLSSYTVVDAGTNRKGVRDFLLAMRSIVTTVIPRTVSEIHDHLIIG